MLRVLAIICICSLSLFSQEYTINLTGNEKKENISFKINFEVDDQIKPISLQKLDIRDIPGINSLKILTAPGLKGTLADEREILIYYKTSLEISGLKIRNLYKVAVLRIYGGESKITLNFDKDHYQNITSLLKYHNIKQETLKDIDNLYGTWTEVDFSQITLNSNDKKQLTTTPEK